MKDDLPFDIVELVACPEPAAAAVALREMPFQAEAWLPEEETILRRMFADDVHLEDIAAHLPGRSFLAVRQRVTVLGLRRNSKRPWTDLDLQYLAERYGRDASSAIALALGRSPAAIWMRAQIQGLAGGGGALDYTPWEDAQVRAGYVSGAPPSQIGVLIGRTLWSIMGRAALLDLRHPNLPADWSNAERFRVLELAHDGVIYPRIAATLEAEGFPKRTKEAVGLFLRGSGYSRGWGRPWMEDEVGLLRRAYANGDSLTPLQELLNRTVHSLKWKAEELGLQGTHPNHDGFRQGPVWTAADDAFLRANYGRDKMPTPTIAAHLGRKRLAVNRRAAVLRLEHGYCRNWTKPELTAISIAYHAGLSMTDLADAIDRQVAVVHRKSQEIGLFFSLRPNKAPRGSRAKRSKLTLAAILAMADKSCAMSDWPLKKPGRPRHVRLAK